MMIVDEKWRGRIVDATKLQHMEFPPLKFVLPGLIPEGAALLVSRPKLGKSWLVLDLAIATAASRFTLGNLKPSSGAVLYLALEDGKRRLQRRITKLLPTFSDSWPEPLKIATEWPRADQGGLADIEAWIVATPDARLVIVDTLAQFRKALNGKTQPYADDYAAISGLQKLASKHNIAIIIVHHDRKAEADDVFDTVSGTLGLTGAADTILIMKRQAGAVGFYVRGRDIEDLEKALQFTKGTCKWKILGEAAEVFRSEERNRVIAALREAGEALSVAEIMEAAGIRTRGAADMLLLRMRRDGELRKSGRGKYELDALDCEKDTQPYEKQDEFGVSNASNNLTQGPNNAIAPDDAPRPPRATNGDRRPETLSSAAAPSNSDPWADLELPESLRRVPPKDTREGTLAPPAMTRVAPPRYCDYCGRSARLAEALNPWDPTPERPDGFWLHKRCEEPWHDRVRMQAAAPAVTFRRP
jgi:AAA domain